MTPVILTDTTRFGETLVEYPAHWAVVMNEQDAQLINPAGDLAATFNDPVFCHAVADLLNAVVDTPLHAIGAGSTDGSTDNESAAIKDAAEVHELLAAANEVVERQNAEIAALHQRYARLQRYMHLVIAVAVEGVTPKNGSSVAPVSVPVAANCDPASVGFPPPAEAGIDLSTDVTDVTDGAEGAEGTHEAEVPA